MAYKICYSSKPIKSKNIRKETRTRKRALLAAAALLAFLILAGTMKYAKLPGNPEVTGTALENMAQTLKDGTSFPEAISAFCKEIVKNGQTSVSD